MRFVVIESTPMSSSLLHGTAGVGSPDGEQVAAPVDAGGEGAVDQAEAVVEPARPYGFEDGRARRCEARPGQRDLGGGVGGAHRQHGRGARAVVHPVLGPALTDDLDDPAYGRAVGLSRQIDHDPAVLGRLEGLHERRYPAAREPAHLVRGERTERPLQLPQPFQCLVVQQHGHLVAGQPYVDLDRVRAQLERGTQRVDGVLADAIGVAAVGHGSHGAHGPIVLVAQSVSHAEA